MQFPVHDTIRMKLLQYIIPGILIILLLPVTGKAQTLVLTPKWTAQAQFAGYYVADRMGFYKDEGVNVLIEHPSVSESSFSRLQDGNSQLAVMNLSFALTACAEGAQLVNILQTSQENSLILVSHSPLPDTSSLQGKEIAVWTHLSDDLLNRLSKYYKLNAKWIRFNGGVNVFLSKAADICLVGSYNEFPQLKECGVEVDSAYMLRLANHGYNLPEDGVYTTKKFYQQHPDWVKKFVRASIRGWEWANEHREETVDIIMDIVRLNNIGTNRYHQRKMLEEILRLQTDRSRGKRTYRLSREEFDAAVRILLDDTEKEKLPYNEFVKQ